MALNFSHKKQATQSGAGRHNASSTESHLVVHQAEIPNVEELEKQIWYYRSHIDVFISEYLSHPDKPVTFFPFQSIIARQVGNSRFIDDVESRSLGKTWKMAFILSSIAILYPSSPILVVSKTVRQAALTIKYIETIASENRNLAREISYPIKNQKDYAKVTFKNGSYIEAMAMSVDGSNIRGLRRKVIYIDESAWVKTPVIQAVLMPILQYKRDIFWQYKDKGFEDYESKLIQTTSAYLKTCDFFPRFKQNLKEMINGNKDVFCCALTYKTGVRYEIIDEEFVDNQKTKMALTSWEMEWNSKFIGATEGSYFPYELTEPCRVLEHVEFAQPRGSKSRYIMSCDIATSANTWADNACIAVLKISEKPDGTFTKHLVCLRSFHGYQLEALASEIRKTAIRFPNTEKILIDVNALGEGIVSLLNTPFVDDEANKEYPPFILDNLERFAGNALPIIRGIRADNKYNARMATAVRIYLENKSLQLPVTSSAIRREVEILDGEGARNSEASRVKRNMLIEETAIFIETDALQYEMGNILPRITVSGLVTYDVLSTNLHKDRYTALGMACEFVMQIEEFNKDEKRNVGDFCIGGSYAM